MPAYVLVEFDDNAQAKRFVEKVNGGYRSVTPEEVPKRRVRAVFSRPTKFCDCVKVSKEERGGKWFVRAAKTGWYVHMQCGKPTRVWAEGKHWFSAIGRNRLPGNTDHDPYTPQATYTTADDEVTHHPAPFNNDTLDGIAEHLDKIEKRDERRDKKRKLHPRREERRPTPPGDMTEQPDWWKERRT